MLIGIDASRANRGHKSGTEWYSYYLIRWLSKLDKENQYILYSDRPLTDGLVDLTGYTLDKDFTNTEVEFDKDGYQVLKSDYGNFRGKVLKWPFRFFWTQGRLSLEMLLHPCRVLFVPAHTLPFIHPRKNIVTIHDVGFEKDRKLYRSDNMGPETSRKGRKIINYVVRLVTWGKYGANSLDYLSWSTRFALKHSRRIITVSNFSKDEIARTYGDKFSDKITVIWNGYNKRLYKRVEDQSKLRSVLHKYGLDTPYLLYVGRLERKKNTPMLIESLAIIKERNKDFKYKLVLVGDASYGYDEVKYAIREYGLDEEVIMPGWIEEKDMPMLYSGATAFIFPSLYEGFGIPLLQAMACGVPIAASNASSIPEVAANSALYFNPNNIVSMSEAIERIATDERLRSELLAKGSERIKIFSWEESARRTLEEIKSL